MSLITLQQFNPNYPFTVDGLNSTLDALAGSINGLAGYPVIQFTPMGGNSSSIYIAQSGGDFTGAITAPAMQIGPSGSRYPVVTTNSLASLTVGGVVLKAAVTATISQTISGTFVKAEMDVIQSKVNELITKLKASGALG